MRRVKEGKERKEQNKENKTVSCTSLRVQERKLAAVAKRLRGFDRLVNASTDHGMITV